MKAERWKSVADGYWVSNFGRVFSEPRLVRFLDMNGKEHFRHKAGRYLGMNLSPYGYLRVNINRKVLHVHQLVARAFLGEPARDELVVNHKDLNKQNNRVDNLEWTTNGENVAHAWENGANSGLCVAVECITTGEVFASLREAADSESKAAGNLCSHLKGRQKSFSGKKWRYLPEWPDKHKLEDQRRRA